MSKFGYFRYMSLLTAVRNLLNILNSFHVIRYIYVCRKYLQKQLERPPLTVIMVEENS
jgi:hypothetical protein